MNILHQGALRAEAEEIPSGGGSDKEVGLMGGLDAFMENEDEENSKDEPKDEKVIDEILKDDDTETDFGIIDEEITEESIGLPEIGSPEKDKEAEETPSFDETGFDTETAQILKSLEEKGHPGEVYQKLRSELKEMKQGGAESSDLQSKLDAANVENEALKLTASQVEAMQEKVTSITSRNAELQLEENLEYKAKVTEPHQEILSTVKAIAEAKGVDENVIWEAMRETDPVKRITAIDSLEHDIGRYANVVEDMSRSIRTIAATDKEMRENAVSIMEDARSKDINQGNESLSTRMAAFKDAANASFQSYANKIPGFTDSTGNLTDASRAAQGKANIVDVNALTEGDLGYMAFSVQALPAALTQVKRLERENRDLRVAAGDKANDVIPGGTPKRAAKEDSHIDAKGNPVGFLDAFNKAEFSKA